MAVFDPQDSARVDWSLLEGGWVTLYQQVAALEADLAWLSRHRYEICRFDCAAWSSEADALRELGTDLGFKDCLDRDGGEDCILDVEIALDGGTVVVLLGYDRFSSVDSKAAQAILNILALNARHFMLLGKRLITLVQSHDPNLAFEPVGALPVIRNRRG